MSIEMDRRGFLKGVAAAGIAAGSMGAVSAFADEAAPALEPTEFVDVDMVVVGAGAAGCSAAVRAAQFGVKVALLEMAAFVGGTTIFTEGMTTLHSHFHKDNPAIDIATEKMVKMIQDYHHWLSNGHIVRQMLEQSATNLEWLESIGFEFTEPQTMCGNTYHTWTMYKKENENDMSGALYVKHWGELVDDTFADQIQVFYNTEGLETKLDDEGAVCAVIAKNVNDGTVTQFNCKAVVYATGGYADNPALFKELVGFGEGEYQSNGAGHRSGDGIIMGRECGAKLCRYPSATMWYGGCLPGIVYGTELYCATAFQPLLWVNENAERFINEEYAEHNFSFSGNGHSTQKRVVSILSQAQMDMFVNEGTIYGCGAYIWAGSKLDGSVTGKAMWDEYQEQLDAGNQHIYTGATIAELAENAGLDPVALQRTIDAYNGYCEAGVDGDFDKPAIYLYPLPEEDGPFYGFDLVPGVFTTVGGLKINDRTQCLAEGDKPIIGMYAAGCDAGGLEGDSYDVAICEGSKQCWCAYSGKLAAEHAAATIFGKEVADEFANPATW
ncbi:MAG: FAD-dependent oxidoreductase [Coriobacteriales bacterium]|nr:FAD-dependent oxidoreductase [Coriobacteriales bacterium]